MNERTGKEVDFANIVKGVDVGGGEYVMVSDEELAQIAPGRSRSLDISGFVDLDEIDPIYFNKAYYLAPSGDESKKTYALLRDAMAKTNRAGVGTFVMHGKQHLAAVRASGNTLVLETLFFADEVRDSASMLDNLPGKTSFSKGELNMATQLVESMAEPWNPKQYRDTYTDRVNELIAAKQKGNEVQVADDAPEATNVVDLLEALPPLGRHAARSGGKKTTAKKAAAKKAAQELRPRKPGKPRDAGQNAYQEAAGQARAVPGEAGLRQDRRAGRIERGEEGP